MKKIFVLIFIATFLVRLLAIQDGNLPFTTDQGRDMVDIREMVVNLKPRLIGPTTSINGVYLGPFWYYFNLPAFVISSGDPSAILIWQIISFQLIGLALFLFIKKFDDKLAFFVSIFYLVMPMGFNTSRYSWNANAMPIFTALFLLLCYLVRQNQTRLRSLLLGLVAGLAFQIEAAFGVIFFPFSILYLLTFTKKPKTYLFNFLGFFVTLLPQILFEVRHQFPLTNVFLSELTGKSEMLGKALSFFERIADRQAVLIRQTQEMSHLPTDYLFPIFIIVSILSLVLIAKKKASESAGRFYVVNLLFIVVTAIFYLLFRQPLKNWYLLGLSVPLVFIYSSSLAILYQAGNEIGRKLIALLVVFSLFFTYTAQSEYLSVSSQLSDNNKSSLKNEIKAVDWIYDQADGRGFKVYSYLPSIYDYPYQHLFWWYGNKQYGYRPNDAAYLPNQPEYIPNRTLYLTPTRDLPSSEPTFLIIENEEQNPQFLDAWLGNFAHLCQVRELVFDFGTIVRQLEKCSK